MDVVGTVASCVDLSTRIVRYVNDLKHRRDDAATLSCKLEAAGIIIKCLHELMTGPHQNADWLRHLNMITSPGPNEGKPLISEYEDLLQTIFQKLEPKAHGSSVLQSISATKDRVSWPFKKVEIQAMARQLTELEISFQSVLQLISIELSIDSLNASTDKEQSWLSNMNPSPQLKSLLEVSESSPPTWIFADDSFKEWSTEISSRVLWAKGNPGAGKSVLAANVIARLRARVTSTSTRTSVAIFFYIYNETVTLESMLRCLLRQLLEQGGPELLLELKEIKGACEASGGLRLTDITSLLTKFWSHFDRNFLVLDALDECDVKVLSTTVLQLKKLLEETSSLCIMVTSRPDMEMYFAESEYLCHAKRVDVTARDADVRQYVWNRIEQIAKRPETALHGTDLDTRQAIVRQVLDRTLGVFLLAVRHMDLLDDCESEHELKETVAKLSSDLGVTYDNVIARLFNQKPSLMRLGRRTLLWLWNSKRQLCFDELKQALATYDSEIDLDSTCMSKAINIVASTKGLISVDQESGIMSTHKTFADFFSLKEKQINVFGNDPNIEMADICTKFLCFSRFATPDYWEDDGKPFYGKLHWTVASKSYDHRYLLDCKDYENPFLSYALSFWIHHLLESDVSWWKVLPRIKSLLSRLPTGIQDTLKKQAVGEIMWRPLHFVTNQISLVREMPSILLVLGLTIFMAVCVLDIYEIFRCYTDQCQSFSHYPIYKHLVFLVTICSGCAFVLIEVVLLRKYI